MEEPRDETWKNQWHEVEDAIKLRIAWEAPGWVRWARGRPET